MLYKNLDALAKAAHDCILNTPESKRIADLIRVYFEALHNPPPSVIGVGAISYAERVLIAAQKEA